MIKLLSLLILCCFLVSCEEEIESYNDLTDSEQRAIDRMSSEKCYTSTDEDFSKFSDASNSRMNNYKRGQNWEVKVTKGSSTSVHAMYVWKKTATATYFLYKDTNSGMNTFIKMTNAFNTEMVDDLQVKRCEKTYPMTNKSTSISLKQLDVPDDVGADRYRVDTTYTVSSTYPAFFGSLSSSGTKKKLQSANQGNNVVSKESMSSKIVYKGDDALGSSIHYTSYTTRQFCVIPYGFNAGKKTFSFPYKFIGCTLSDSTNANTGGDPSMDFTANNDL